MLGTKPSPSHFEKARRFRGLGGRARVACKGTEFVSTVVRQYSLPRVHVNYYILYTLDVFQGRGGEWLSHAPYSYSPFGRRICTSRHKGEETEPFRRPTDGKAGHSVAGLNTLHMI